MKFTTAIFSLFAGAVLSQTGFAAETAKNEHTANPRMYENNSPKDNFFFGGEFLYWKTLNGGDNIGTFGTSSTGYATGVIGDVIRVKPDFDIGARAFIGYQSDYNWNVLGRWTYYHNTETTVVNAKPDCVVYPLLMDFNFSPVANSLCSDWKFKMNVFDVDIGYTWVLANRFSITPFMGGRAAFIRRNLRVIYNDVNFGGNITEDFVNCYNAQRVNGAGLKIGFMPKFMLGEGFSLISNCATSFLWASNDQSILNINPDGSTRTAIQDNYQGVVPVLEILFGIMWESDFKMMDNDFNIGLYVNWEQQTWFNLSRTNHFIDSFIHGVMSTNAENLGLAGLSAGFILKF